LLFNSYEFLFVFLPIALVGFYALSLVGSAQILVAAIGFASLVFYAIGQPGSVPLLVLSIVVNFTLGNALILASSGSRRKAFLLIGLLFDLGTLAYFKYTAFAVSSLNAIGLASFAVPTILLPVGISFFTFTQIAYLVDCYGRRAGRYGFDEYLFFVTFFPHLVAGPILNHKRIIPQLRDPGFIGARAHNMWAGVLFFSFGLFKKVIVADSIAPYVGDLFSGATSLSMWEAWAAAALYAFQLYFDFSGYSDMAVGLGLMLNVRLPFNFDSPYKSTSIIEFWRRWHISLSNFLRDYLYIPLGGNRRGELRRLLNIFITMLLGGLWHGAGWTFVIWGALHGAFIVINHLWRRTGIRLPAYIGWALTMAGVVVAWVFFRAASASDALAIAKAMAGLGGAAERLHSGLSPLQAALSVAALALWCVKSPNTQQVVERWSNRPIVSVGAALAAVSGLLFVGQPSVFLYYQF
jgi:alginate O-acetyltransferase complex protein AlgI